MRQIEHFRFEESTPVHRPVAILLSGRGEDDRFLRYPLQPNGCKRILMALIVSLEDHPRQSAELPRAVADGDVRREPSSPAATAKVGRRLLTRISQHLARAVGYRPLLGVEGVAIRHLIFPQSVGHGDGARGVILVNDCDGAATRKAIQEPATVAMLMEIGQGTIKKLARLSLSLRRLSERVVLERVIAETFGDFGANLQYQEVFIKSDVERVL